MLSFNVGMHAHGLDISVSVPHVLHQHTYITVVVLSC